MSARSLVQNLTKRSSSSIESPAAIFFIRAMVGSVFLSEGIQKFLFSESLGVGRFVKIGIPAPEIMAPFVGVVEILFGALILLGLFTRLASIPLLIDIVVAILTTKIPMLLESGFWKMAHEARTDLSMLLGLLFLLIVGGGRWSLDGIRAKRSDNQNQLRNQGQPSPE
jgi:putative oxidoreductase